MVGKVLAAKRRQLLTRQLAERGGVAVGDMARQFGVSTETIRKDLIFLEQQGLALKSHGGAVPAGDLLERPTVIKGAENPDAKAEIARTAREMIPDNAIVLMDAGSTTFALAQLVAEMEGVTVFTNSVPIMSLLGPTNNHVFCVGGQLRGSSMAAAGAWTVSAVRGIRVDVAFLGTDGFEDLAGPSSASYEEVQFKAAAVEVSSCSIILSDHSKFTHRGLFQFCGWRDVYALVTDSAAPQEAVTQIGQQTRVMVADSQSPGSQGS